MQSYSVNRPAARPEPESVRAPSPATGHFGNGRGAPALRREASAWEDQAEALAVWVDRHLVNRRDTFGQYIAVASRRDPDLTALTSKARLTARILVRHFRGQSTGHLIGLHSTHRDKDGRCWSRWLAIDIDRHEERTCPEKTLAAALALYERALALGFTPLLIDSDGRGGYHLLILFDGPVPTAQAYQFGQWLVRDWQALGLDGEPETFPKQATIPIGGYGNWLRVFGRHHTRAHWAKVYQGGEWLGGHEAIEVILQTTGQPATLIPAEATQAPAPARRPTRKPAILDLEGDAKRAESALGSLGHLVDDYHGWIQIGMALTPLGSVGLALWDAWSSGSSKYEEGNCERKWRTFTRDGGLGLGTLFHEAKLAGRTPPRTPNATIWRLTAWQERNRLDAPRTPPERTSAPPERTSAPAPAPEAPAGEAVELTAIAKAMRDDLHHRRVALHVAPTGSGKSYSAAQVAVHRYHRGQLTLIALPTLRLAEETSVRIRAALPGALEAGELVELYGRAALLRTDEDDDDEGEADDEEGHYPIDEDTKVVICTHAQLARRGFSAYLRAIWQKLGAQEGKQSRRSAFAIIIDEVSELVRESRREIALAHRYARRNDPDRSGGWMTPLRDCPKSNRSGNCDNCQLAKRGGEPRFNRFGIREIGPPRPTELDQDGRTLRTPRAPLAVHEDDLDLGPKAHISGTTFAAPVLTWQGRLIDEWERINAPLWLFSRAEDGSQPAETPAEVLGHMLQFAFRPVVTWEHPINEADEIVSVETLALRIGMKDKKWDEGVIFPWQTCNVPRLRFTDLAVFEKLRRFAAEESVGLILAGATLGPDEGEILRSVWPDLVEHAHPYPERKVGQVAVVCPSEFFGPGSWIAEDGRLATAPLERHEGLGLVFCATKRIARHLYEAIALAQPSARLAIENHRELTFRGTLHHEAEVGTLVTYSRGVLGLGANVLGVRYLMADARAFRSIAGFTPGELTPEEFERMRAEERTALILQNLGRALRGEKGKTVALIVLNADEALKETLRSAPAIREGSERPPVFAEPTDRNLAGVIEQTGLWLANGGGDWPKTDPKPGKKRGRPTRSRESVLKAAEEAIAAGMPWWKFNRKHNARRHFEGDDFAELRARFP